jgi:glutamate synthase (NADPH) large chain
MTGGRVVVIGPTGRNFAAGMSGGIAYVYNYGDFDRLCNQDMVSLESRSQFTDEDVETIRTMLENHVKYTDSPIARGVLDNWESELAYFVKVMPNDYRRVLAEQSQIEARAAALARSQNTDGDGDGDAAAGETLVNAGVRKGGSDVGVGNNG